MARAIGWLFVAAIAYHAVLAAIQAEQAGSDGKWAHAVELVVIAIVATALVVAAVVTAMRSSTRAR